MAELPDGQWASILDVEQLLAGVFGEAAPPELAPLDGGPYHAFYADDSVIARRKIAQVLDGLGIRHQHATRGREAWDKLRALAAAAQAEGVPLRERMQLILLDGEMPEMDGFQACTAVRATGYGSRTPILMLTTEADGTIREQARAAGATGFLPKPFDPDGLTDSVMQLFEWHAQTHGSASTH